MKLYYCLSKNPSVKIWTNKFQMVNKLCDLLPEFPDKSSMFPAILRIVHYETTCINGPR